MNNSGIFNFQFKLDVDYDTWMNCKNKYDKQFRYEMGDILKISPNHIRLDDYQRGSVILWMRAIIRNIKRWLKRIRNELPNSELDADFLEKVKRQDQISVHYLDGKWYDATVICVKEDEKGDKHFKVRYNPLDNKLGSNPFWINTDWFYSKEKRLKQHWKLRYPGKKFGIFKDEQGENRDRIWRSPDITFRNSVYEIRINDHIFVKCKNEWRRSKVFDREQQTIKVKDLIEGNKILLSLENQQDQERIKFVDMTNVFSDV